MTKPIRDPARAPTHPGEILREDVLPVLDMPVLDMPVQTAAKRLGVSRQTLHRILAGTHPVTSAMALRLGKFRGNGPALWLSLQQAFDLWHAATTMADELAKIETARAA